MTTQETFNAKHPEAVVSVLMNYRRKCAEKSIRWIEGELVYDVTFNPWEVSLYVGRGTLKSYVVLKRKEVEMRKNIKKIMEIVEEALATNDIQQAQWLGNPPTMAQYIKTYL